MATIRMSSAHRARAFLCSILVLACPEAIGAADLDRFVMANGMEVVLVEDHSRAIVAAEGCFRGGARTEAQDEKGLSHLHEHLIGRGGTRRQPRKEWQTAKSRLGFGAYTGPDGVCFQVRVPGRDLEEAVWRFADAIFALELDEESVDRERGVVLLELGRGRDMPFGHALHQLYPAAFVRHPYRTMTIGLDEVIRNVDLDGLSGFYHKRFRPNHFFLAVVGDFESSSLRSMIGEAFGAFEAGQTSLEIAEMEPRQESFRLVASKGPAETTELLLGCRIPAAVGPDAAAVVVLAAVVEQRLREALIGGGRAAVSAWASADLRHDPSLLQIGLTAAHDGAETAWIGLWEELLRLASEGPGSDETSRARSGLEAAAGYDRDSFSRYASELAAWELSESFTLADLFPQQLATVTPDDVRQAAIRYLNPSQCTLSLVCPEESLEPQLRAETSRVAALWPRVDTGRRVGSAAERLNPGSGLNVLVKTVPGSQIQALHVVFPPRSGDSSPAVRNVAARLLPLLGHEALGDLVQAAGGRLEVDESPDGLEIGLSAPAGRFAPLVVALANVLRLRALPADAVDAARREGVADLTSRGQSAENEVRDRLGVFLFGDRHPYGRRATTAEIEGVGTADLLSFFSRELDAGAAVLVFVGPAGTDQVRSLLRSFEAKAGAAGVHRLPWPPVMPSDERHLTVSRELAEVKVALGLPAVPGAHQDYPALRLAASILWSRLFYTFVRGEDDPIAYRLLASFQPGLGPRPFLVEAGVEPGTEQLLIDRVFAEVAELCRKGPSLGELDHAASVLSQRLILDADGSAVEAALLAQHAALSSVGVDLGAVGDRYRSLTALEVRSAVCRHLEPTRWKVALLGPVEGDHL